MRAAHTHTPHTELQLVKKNYQFILLNVCYQHSLISQGFRYDQSDSRLHLM